MTGRADLIRAVLEAEAIAAAYKERAQVYRAALQAEAVADLGERRAAPSWHVDGLALASLPLSKPGNTVVDQAVLTKWVTRQYPAEAEGIIQVRPPFQAALLARLEPTAGRRRVTDPQTQQTRTEAVVKLVDPSTGKHVPGVTQRPGGKPGSLRITPAAAAKDRLALLGQSALEWSDLPGVPDGPR